MISVQYESLDFRKSSLDQLHFRIWFLHLQYAQKPHMHINFKRHFYKIILMSILNLILKSGHINIALLHDKISNKCHKISSIGTLMCFIDTFCLINTNRF